MLIVALTDLGQQADRERSRARVAELLIERARERQTEYRRLAAAQR